jgi:hypothetical protein
MRNEIARLTERLAAMEKQLEDAWQAKADSDVRRERAEGHAQALQFRLDALL